MCLGSRNLGISHLVMCGGDYEEVRLPIMVFSVIGLFALPLSSLSVWVPLKSNSINQLQIRGIPTLLRDFSSRLPCRHRTLNIPNWLAKSRADPNAKKLLLNSLLQYYCLFLCALINSCHRKGDDQKTKHQKIRDLEIYVSKCNITCLA
jgi:hypothetical protein